MEQRLRAAEYLLSVLSLANASHSLHISKLKSRLNEAWELVLCNQFHDVLPGSCIEDVVHDAIKYYQRACELTDFSHDSVNRTEELQVDLKSWSILETSSTENFVQPQNLLLENDYLKAEFNPEGQIVSLYAKSSNSIDHIVNLASASSPLNVFKVFSDMPLFWDAWDVMDYYAETGVAVKAKSFRADENCLCFNFDVFGTAQSSLSMTATLPVDSPYLVFKLSVDWKEAHKILRVEFPFNLRARSAFYGSQIGYIERTNSLNTSQDTAKIEVCGHKWAAMQQHGLGCAILTPDKYGFRALDSNLSLSLLRSPKSPDGNADIGNHDISYALMPYVGTFQSSSVQKHADQFNCDSNIKHCTFSIPTNVFKLPDSCLKLSSPAVRIESFKISEEKLDCFALKLSEQFGSTVKCSVSFNEFPLAGYSHVLCDILERPLQGSEWKQFSNPLEVVLEPFKLVCVLFKK